MKVICRMSVGVFMINHQVAFGQYTLRNTDSDNWNDANNHSIPKAQQKTLNSGSRCDINPAGTIKVAASFAKYVPSFVAIMLWQSFRY